jgi:glycosyltransferase involved in cell wall biosynthesis
MKFNDYNKKRISFVLATNNREDYLESFLTRWNDFKKPIDELIIIDGSNNNKLSKVNERFPELVDIYISEKDLNGVEAYNKGFLLAQGEFVKNIMDDDDFYPEAFEKAVEVMRNNPELDFIVCGGTRSRDGNNGNIYVPPGSSFGKTTDEVYKYTRSGVGFFFRRKLLSLTGMWEVDSVSCDAAFLIRSISLGAHVRFCRINMVHHTLHNDSKSVKDQSEKFIERDKLIRQYCSEGFQRKWFRNQRWHIKFAKRLLGMIITNVVNSDNSDYKQKNDPIWDGGLS